MALGLNMKAGKTKPKGLVPEKKSKTDEIIPVQKTGSATIEAKTAPVAERPPARSDLADLRNASITLEPSRRKKIRKVRVFLEGELTISNSEAFLHRILPIFDQFDFIDFSLHDVTSLDLSFIQMLYHVKKCHAKESKEVTIDSQLPPDLKKIIVCSGFERLMFKPKLI